MLLSVFAGSYWPISRIFSGLAEKLSSSSRSSAMIELFVVDFMILLCRFCRGLSDDPLGGLIASHVRTSSLAEKSVRSPLCGLVKNPDVLRDMAFEVVENARPRSPLCSGFVVLEIDMRQ